MAEGARLESVYTGNRIEGSNPSLSAITFVFLWLQLVIPALIETGGHHPLLKYTVSQCVGKNA